MNITPLFLDYNATTPIHPDVFKAMEPYWADQFGNASSRHRAGQSAWRAVERARVHIAQLTQSRPEQVIFTSGATESNFLALEGRFEQLIASGRSPDSIRIAISSIEHPCVKACVKKLERRGAVVEFIPTSKACQVDALYLCNHPAFDIVSVMTANHETGVLQPIEDIARIAKVQNPNVFIHTDAAQWAGRTDFAFSSDVSAISISAHKMYGPKGVGALILREAGSLQPLFSGSQEAGLRAGTVNVPGAVGFGKAAERMLQERDGESQRLRALREKLWNMLSEIGVDIERTVNHEAVLPQTLHVRFIGMKGERVADTLDRLGIYCSPGPACASGASEASPVLRAMGFSEKQVWEGVRFSLGRCTSSGDLCEAKARIVQLASLLRSD